MKYDEAIRKEAKYPIAHNNRGLALHKLGRLEDAVSALEKAIELDWRQPAYQLNLGKVLAAAGRYQDALQALDKALEIDPSLAAALYNRAWVLDALDQLAEAAQACSRLTALPRPPPGSKLLAGIVEARRGQALPLAEATCTPDDLPQRWRWLTEANRSLATRGGADMSAAARDALLKGLLAASTEQFQTAQEHFSNAASAAPENPLPLWLSAMLFTTQGSHQDAEASMKQAAPLMPTFSIPECDDPTVLLVNGVMVGPAPTQTSLLPGVHLVNVVRRSQDEYSIFSKCGVFQPGKGYRLPAVEFRRMPSPVKLLLPQGRRAELQSSLAPPP